MKWALVTVPTPWAVPGMRRTAGEVLSVVPGGLRASHEWDPVQLCSPLYPGVLGTERPRVKPS